MWAAHDPEGWDEVCTKGIKEKILKEDGLLEKDLTEGELAGIRTVLHVLRGSRQHPYVYEAWVLLSLWAQEEVAQHEADYLMSKYGRENA